MQFIPKTWHIINEAQLSISSKFNGKIGLIYNNTNKTTTGHHQHHCVLHALVSCREIQI